MRLFIAEKPSLAREIAKGLGGGQRREGYIEIGNGQDIVTWEFGHLLKNFDPEDYDEKYRTRGLENLPIVPEHWQQKVVPDGKKQLGIIKNLLAKVDSVVNAGDPDREGQLLVDELLEYLGNDKPVQRVLLNALDERSVHQALGSLRDNAEFAGLKNSARARSYADWLVGMNLSRAYSVPVKQAGYQRGVRIGRVKTPTMALVLRREEEIKNFKPVQYYQVQIDWQYGEGSIRSLWQPGENVQGLDLDDRLADRSVADGLLTRIGQANSMAVVTKIEEEHKTEPQRLPYSLSSLQVEAGRKFGYDPKTVLACMQSLYEMKLTTYPRSDCDFLPENQFSDAAEILQNLQGVEELASYCAKADTGIRSRAWNDKKISAHHAIIPTRQKCDLSSLDEKQRNLYLFVTRAYIAQFYSVHSFQSTKLWIECDGEVFKATGKVVKDMGWRELYAGEAKEGEEEEKALPDISEGETVRYLDGKVLDKMTKPPTRFTPATLLKAMKEIHKYVKDESLKAKLKSVSGIGTEATRANIIDELTTAGLLKLEKKYLLPTDEAYMMLKFLPDTITWPDTTAIWEDELEDIRENRLTIEEFLESKIDSIKRCVDGARYLIVEPAKDTVKCPKCGRALVRKKGKAGCFWGCAGYPTCNVTFPDKKGKPDLEDHTQPCPVCKTGRLRKINGKYGTFWGCNNPECKKTFRDDGCKPVVDTDDVKCPSCGKPMRLRNGKKGYFWGCSGYPDCKQTLQEDGDKPKQK